MRVGKMFGTALVFEHSGLTRLMNGWIRPGGGDGPITGATVPFGVDGHEQLMLEYSREDVYVFDNFKEVLPKLDQIALTRKFNRRFRGMILYLLNHFEFEAWPGDAEDDDRDAGVLNFLAGGERVPVGWILPQFRTFASSISIDMICAVTDGCHTGRTRSLAHLENMIVIAPLAGKKKFSRSTESFPFRAFVDGALTGELDTAAANAFVRWLVKEVAEIIEGKRTLRVLKNAVESKKDCDGTGTFLCWGHAAEALLDQPLGGLLRGFDSKDDFVRALVAGLGDTPSCGHLGPGRSQMSGEAADPTISSPRRAVPSLVGVPAQEAPDLTAMMSAWNATCAIRREEASKEGCCHALIDAVSMMSRAVPVDGHVAALELFAELEKWSGHRLVEEPFRAMLWALTEAKVTAEQFALMLPPKSG